MKLEVSCYQKGKKCRRQPTDVTQLHLQVKSRLESILTSEGNSCTRKLLELKHIALRELGSQIKEQKRYQGTRK